MAVTTRTGRKDTPAPTPDRRAGGGRPGGGDAAVNVFSHVVLIGWSVMVLVPFAWALLASVKTSGEIFGSPWSLPESPQWANFAQAWDKGVGQYLLNSVIVVTGGVVLTMLFGSMAAYVLARYRFPGNRPLYYLFAAGMMFPVFLAIVPLFFVVQNLGMLSTYQGLILVYVAYSLPFTVFFMHAFFKTLPTAIAEAAFIDGCSHSALFFRVMLPMAKPGLISIGIFNVIGQWNQWYLPVLLMQPDGGEAKKAPIAQALIDLSVNQGYRSDWSGMFAGLTMAMLPVLAVYIIFQRQVQAGLTGSITK